MEKSEKCSSDIRREIIVASHNVGKLGVHLGPALSAADILAVLYADVLSYDVGDPESEVRDDFVLSKGNAYIGYLKDAFLISKAQRYDVKGKRYINSPYKIYFEDIGLRNARLNFRQIEEGHILENIIYNELIVRGYRVDVGEVEFFKKDENGKTMRIDYEVDFIVNRGSERFYIQSAYEIPGVEKEIQEKNSLRSINDSFKKIIITKGYMKPRIDDEGIITIGVINFLLDDSILS